MRKLITILFLLSTVIGYSQINTIKVGGIDTAFMLDPYKHDYPRQAISLVFTTSGSSGASTATYSNSTGVFTINIPQYSGGSSGITALTGDVTASGTGSVAATLATVNSNVGTFKNATITANGKGLITAATTANINDSRLIFSDNGAVKDTSTLVYDRTNGNVGIGLTTPAQKLDVNGQIKIGLGNVSQIYPRSDAGQLSIYGSVTPVKGAYILLNSANPSGFSDSGSALINYGDYTAVAPTNSLLRFRYANNGRAWDNLSVNANGYAGVNTNSAHNPLSVEPRKYTTGQASQSGATVTGVGTTWTADMVGDYFKWPSQTFPADRITAVNSTTSITLALEQPVGNATVSDYEILRVGLQVTPLGRVGIGTATPTQAFHVTGQARIDSLLTGSGSDSVVVVNNGTLKKILQSSVTGTGTVTSVAALTLGTSGSDLSSSVATSTTTPVITLNVPTASASNRGAVSSTDWSTFNSKQATVSVTTPITLTGASIGMVNQGTTTTVLHGNASGNPSFGAIVNGDITNGTIDLTSKVTGLLPDANISSASTWNAKRSSTGSTGDLASFSASNTPSNISAVATGYLLGSQGTSTLPAWLQAATLNSSLTTPLIIGNGGTTTPITYKVTTGVGSTGADHIFQVGNNGATEAMRILNSGLVGIGTAAPTHSLTFPSTATGVALYNTSDQTTNYERGLLQWTANQLTLSTAKGGTGTNRNISISAANRIFMSGVDLVSIGAGTQLALSSGSSSITLANNGTTYFTLFSGIITLAGTQILRSGTATASTSPIKFSSGTNLTTPEAGAEEYDGTERTATNSTAVRGFYVLVRLNSSSAGTLTLATTYTHYVFTGTTTTWTLPAVSGTTGHIFYIKNRGSGAITLNTAASANELYTTAAVATLTINAGEGYAIVSDGTYFDIQSKY